ncbi:MAG TPA: ParB/RepB/Spo0J family partition protein [Thermoplasmata archaeon]|nr:ParB/RepB/Spo0J family partition protein [Thermoplasmata archaeon]
MATEAAKATEQPMTRTEPEYTNAPISELEKTDGKNIREVDTSTLTDLAASIKERGILEPVLVTRSEKGLRLVAGFRRVAAAKMIGSKSVPARVLPLTELEVLESQLVENLQRQDLSPIEEAKALKSLLEASGLTQEQVGKKIGKSQSYVASRVRLLSLPENGAKLLASGKITASAAERLVSLPDAAAPEMKRAFSELERRAAYRGSVSVIEARDAADGARRSYQERLQREKTVAAAKFPSCPGCGKAGRPDRWNLTGPFSCANGHEWIPSTGKVVARRSQSASSTAAPPKPTLPLVDQKVSVNIPVQQITNRILGAVKGVHSVQISWRQGTRASLWLDVEMPALKGAKVPDIEVDEGRKFVWLSRFEKWAQRDDLGRKTAAERRSNLEGWLATIGKHKKDD